jgi:hypothetical protein
LRARNSSKELNRFITIPASVFASNRARRFFRHLRRVIKLCDLFTWQSSGSHQFRQLEMHGTGTDPNQATANQ